MNALLERLGYGVDTPKPPNAIPDAATLFSRPPSPAPYTYGP